MAERQVDSVQLRNEQPGDQGDQFSRLIVANQRRIYSFIRTLVPEKNSADDLLQEVSATAWQKFSTFDPETDFAVWAMSIARFKILNWRRGQKKQPLNLDSQHFDLLADQAVATSCQFDQRQDALLKCIQGLKEPERALLSQRYQMEQSVSDIAKQKAKSRVAVHRHLAKIHSHLLQCIDRRLQIS